MDETARIFILILLVGYGLGAVVGLLVYIVTSLIIYRGVVPKPMWGLMAETALLSWWGLYIYIRVLRYEAREKDKEKGGQ